MRPSSARRSRLTVAAALAASLLLAGCGGGDKDAGDASDDSKATPTKPAEPDTWPLTGLELPAGASATTEHPVFTVKIDNSAKSQPQVGLGKADLVVEELVEGRTTRLAVMFYSQLPSLVGPIRSMRTTDIGIVSPVKGHLVTSGAAVPTIQRLNKAGVKFHEEGSPGMFRESSRSSLYSVMTDLTKLAASLEKRRDPERPADYLAWGKDGDLPAGQPAAGLSAAFGNHTTNWVFRNGKYHNVNTYAAKGDAFLADTVLVLRVKVVSAGYEGYAGAFVPESRVVGTGEAMIFHKGGLIRGTWSKDALDSQLTLATQAGEVKIPAGKVWIELVPTDDYAGVTIK